MKRGLTILVLIISLISLVSFAYASNYTNYTSPSNQTNYTAPSNYTSPSNQTNYTIRVSNYSNYTIPSLNYSNFTVSIGNNSNINISITSNASNFTSANLSIEQAISKAKYVDKVENVLLDVESGKLVYSISGEKKGNLIAIIPVSARVEQKIDATYGDIISTKKPWWSFLATKI